MIFQEEISFIDFDFFQSKFYQNYYLNFVFVWEHASSNGVVWWIVCFLSAFVFHSFLIWWFSSAPQTVWPHVCVFHQIFLFCIHFYSPNKREICLFVENVKRIGLIELYRFTLRNDEEKNTSKVKCWKDTEGGRTEDAVKIIFMNRKKICRWHQLTHFFVFIFRCLLGGNQNKTKNHQII